MYLHQKAALFGIGSVTEKVTIVCRRTGHVSQTWWHIHLRGQSLTKKS